MKSEDFISTTNVNPIEIWPAILDEIAKNTSSISFDVWIKTLEIEDIKENLEAVQDKISEMEERVNFAWQDEEFG